MSLPSYSVSWFWALWVRGDRMGGCLGSWLVWPDADDLRAESDSGVAPIKVGLTKVGLSAIHAGGGWGLVVGGGEGVGGGCGNGMDVGEGLDIGGREGLARLFEDQCGNGSPDGEIAGAADAGAQSGEDGAELVSAAVLLPGGTEQDALDLLGEGRLLRCEKVGDRGHDIAVEIVAGSIAALRLEVSRDPVVVPGEHPS